MKFRVTTVANFEIEINDSRVLDRVVHNEDGWRQKFYDLHDTEDVIKHLAWNLGINRLQINQLDGWADLDESAATCRLVWTEVDDVDGLL